MSTTALLDRGSQEQLGRLQHRLRRELSEYECGGLAERAQQTRRELAQVEGKLADHQKAQQELEADRRAQRRRHQEWLEARKADAEERISEAVDFLSAALADGPIRVDQLVRESENENIETADLLAAAHELELRQLAWLKSNTRTLPDRSRGFFWSLSRPLQTAGRIDLGPASLRAQ